MHCDGRRHSVAGHEAHERAGAAAAPALRVLEAQADRAVLEVHEFAGRVCGRCKRSARAGTEGSPCPGTEGSPAAEAQLVGIRRNEDSCEAAEAHPTAVWPTYHCSVVGQVLLPWFGRSTELAACKALGTLSQLGLLGRLLP